MKKVANLSNNHTWNYTNDVSDLFAVCCTYCLNNNLSSWFYSKVKDDGDYASYLPVIKGGQTLACGDYCIVSADL